MVLLSSKPIDKNFSCPDFSLPSVDGKNFTRNDFDGSRALLVAFICNHCPYVKAIEDRLIDLAKTFDKKDFQMVAICSNDADSYPDDAPQKLFERWQNKKYGFVYLIDSTQEVAKKFDAICTPDLFLFDQERKLYYRGELDDNWQDEQQVKNHSLKDAIKKLLNNEPSPKDQKPAIGCSIKWK